MVLISGLATTAVAETPTASGDILWLIDGAPSGPTAEVVAGIDEALAAEREGHLLGDGDLLERIDGDLQPVSDCVLGLTSCGPAEAMAFDALGLGLMIRLQLTRDDEQVEINYEMVDRRGEVAGSGVVSAPDARRAGFEVVSQLFDAVGVVSFESSPSGATVEVEGEVIGETPMSRQFGVGSYGYRIHTDDYDGESGRFEVRTGEAHRVDVELAEQPGSLRVSGAPDDALIWLGDGVLGRASEVMQLEVGHHVIEVRAEGYENYRRGVQIDSGQMTDIDVDLQTMPTIFRDVSRSEIADHRFQFDLGLEFGFQQLQFLNASGTIEGEEVRFEQWIFDDDEGESLSVTPGGLRLGFGWEGDRLGVTFLSASLRAASVDQPVEIRSPADGVTVAARATDVRTLQLRPMQGRLRFFYENLAPYVQGGLGVAFHWIDVHISDDREVELFQAEPFAALELGARYHFDARWSVGASLRFQGYFADGMGGEGVLGISVGTGLRDLPGMEPQPPGEL